MGTVHNKMKKKHKKPINHENIDVNRSKTLQVLEQLKTEESNHEHSYPVLSILSNSLSNMEITDNQTTSIPRNDNNIIINHKFSSAPQLLSAMSSNNVRVRKVLKDGRIVKEVVQYDNSDQFDNAVHVKANSTKSQQHSCDFSEHQNEPNCSSSCRNNECDSIDIVPSNSKLAFSDEEDLTLDDMDRRRAMGKNYTPAKYHAYVNYPEEYLSVAIIIVKTLEKPPYNLRLFLPDRQLLSGGYDLVVKSDIIEKRCSGKVISLLGGQYKDADSFHFINHFSKSLDPVPKEPKLIPVLIEELKDIPRIMKGMYLIRYYKDSDRGFFWDKLSNSIKNCEESTSCPSRLNKL